MKKELTEERIMEIRKKVTGIDEMYRERHSVHGIADVFGISEGAVRKTLNLLGYWHGINRLEEPVEGRVTTVGLPFSSFGFLL